MKSEVASRKGINVLDNKIKGLHITKGHAGFLFYLNFDLINSVGGFSVVILLRKVASRKGINVLDNKIKGLHITKGRIMQVSFSISISISLSLSLAFL